MQSRLSALQVLSSLTSLIQCPCGGKSRGSATSHHFPSTLADVPAQPKGRTREAQPSSAFTPSLKPSGAKQKFSAREGSTGCATAVTFQIPVAHWSGRIIEVGGSETGRGLARAEKARGDPRGSPLSYYLSRLSAALTLYSWS